MQGNDDAVVSLVVDARGLQQGSAEALALGKSLIATFDAIRNAASSTSVGITASGVGIVKSLGDTNRFLNQIERSLNPLAAAANKAEAEMNRLMGIMGGSNVQASQRAFQALEGQTKKFLELKNVVALASNENKALEATYVGLERAFQNAIGSLGSLISKYQPASASAKLMTSELASLNQAFKAGLVTQEQYVGMNSKIISSYNEEVIAAQRLAEARAKLISSSRADQNVQNNQNFFNQTLGVNPGSGAGSAAASASVFQKQFAFDKELFDMETRGYERVAAAQKIAMSSIINKLKEYQSEQVKATQERFKFQEQIAPSSNIAEHRAVEDAKKFSDGLKDVGLNSRLAQYALTNFSFQVNDVVSGLAMGQAPFRIFAQQAGQFVQIFQQIGRENIGQFFKDMGQSVVSFGQAAGRWLVAHPILVALTAIGSGIAVIVTNSLAAETRIRSFSVILNSMGTEGLSSARQLDEVVRKLRDTGSAAADAQKAVQGIARTSGINPGAIGNIANLGRNISAARGIDLETATSGLTGAIANGADALTQYALSLGVKLNPAEQKAIDLAILHRDRLEQLRVTYSAISRTMDGEFDKSLSEGTRLVNNLFGAWHNLMDTLSDSSGFKHAVGAGTMLLDVLNKLISGQELYNKKSLEYDLGLNKPGALENFRNMRQQAGLPIVGGTGSNVSGLQGLAPEFAEGLKGLIAAAAEQGITIGIQSGLRSTERQSELFAADVAKHGGTPSGMVARPGGSMHEFGFAADLNRDPRALEFARQNANKFGLSFPMQGQGGMPNEPWHIELAGARGNLTVPTSAGGIAASQQVADIKLRSEALNKYALDLVQAQAKISAVAEAEQKFKEATPENELQKQQFVTNTVNEATAKFNDELNKGIRVENLRTKGVEDTSKAINGGTSEMLKAAATAEANNKVLTEGISFQEAYREALARGAAEAVKGAAEQIAAQVPVITGQQKLAEAAKISGQAEHDVRIQNEANIVTQRALDAERAKGNIIVGAEVDLLNKKAKAQILATEAANNSLVVTRAQNQAADQIKVLQLQGNLLGGTTEEINRQVVLLQKKQELERDTTGLTDQQKVNILAATDAVQRQNVILAGQTREWGRIEEALKSIADQIGSTLTTVIDGLFDKSKVTNWRDTFVSALRSIGNQLIQMALIKPLTGSIFSALGFGNLGQQYGTFGGSSSGGSTLNNLGTVGGIAKDSFSLFGGGSSSSSSSGLFGGGGFFGDIGGSISSSLVGQAGPLIGAEGLAGGGIGTSGLLGSGGNLLGIAGLGLSSVLPVLGIAAGVGSLLFGSLFQKKPSNFASGGLLDLGGLSLSGVNSSGNAQNDSTSKQILGNVSDFVKSLTAALPGSAVTGSLWTNIGTRDGIKVGGNVGSFATSGEGVKFGSAEEAIKAIELVIMNNLQGVISDTANQVIHSLTDPAQLQDALTFITVYDNLKRQFDSAFDSVASDLKKIGPFEQAFNQIGTIFDDLTAKANLYGLSLDPINAGLVEAHKRLIDDMYKSISDAELAITDPLRSIVNIEKEAGKARVDDAIAIGAQITQVNQLNALKLTEIWKNQTQALSQLADSLRSGDLSGLTIGGQRVAANDNFQRILGLVKGGNLGEITNLAPAAQNAFTLSQTAFGNAPQTATLRSQILDSIDNLLSNRSFAGGSSSTPEGWIRVGENGPEWMRQSGGNTILPSGTKPSSSSNDDLNGKIDKLIDILEGGNNIARFHGSISEKGFGMVVGELRKNKSEEKTRRKVA